MSRINDEYRWHSWDQTSVPSLQLFFVSSIILISSNKQLLNYLSTNIFRLQHLLTEQSKNFFAFYSVKFWWQTMRLIIYFILIYIFAVHTINVRHLDELEIFVSTEIVAKISIKEIFSPELESVSISDDNSFGFFISAEGNCLILHNTKYSKL